MCAEGSLDDVLQVYNWKTSPQRFQCVREYWVYLLVHIYVVRDSVGWGGSIYLPIQFVIHRGPGSGPTSGQ